MTDSVTKPHVLDSFALLAFLNKESGFAQVRGLLRVAEKTAEPLLMNEINIGEVYYIIAKTRAAEKAETFLHLLETLPIEPVANAFPDVLAAARLKAQFPMSYADAFATSTALRTQAVVVTGDPEFQAVAHLVEILWL